MSGAGNTFTDLLAREAQLRADVRNPEITEIDMPPAFFKEQIGLRTIMADPIGRIWDVADNPIRMIFDPFSLSRKKEK